MKTRFNVELFEGYPSAAEKAIIAAAMVNGGEYNLPLSSITKMAETEKESWPNLNEETSIEQVTDSLLRIDTKVNGEWKTVCRIEMVEVGELATIDDLQDVL